MAFQSETEKKLFFFFCGQNTHFYQIVTQFIDWKRLSLFNEC